MAAMRATYEPVAQAAATAVGINVPIFLAQITQESGWDPQAQSPAGAQGIAQIVPRFHPTVDPWDPVASLQYAARLMRGYLDEFGTYALSLAAYNAGSGAVRQYGGIPPFPETQHYVRTILAAAGGEPPSGGDPSGNGQPSAAADALPAALVLAGLLVAAAFLLWWRPRGSRA